MESATEVPSPSPFSFSGDDLALGEPLDLGEEKEAGRFLGVRWFLGVDPGGGPSFACPVFALEGDACSPTPLSGGGGTTKAVCVRGLLNAGLVSSFDGESSGLGRGGGVVPLAGSGSVLRLTMIGDIACSVMEGWEVLVLMEVLAVVVIPQSSRSGRLSSSSPAQSIWLELGVIGLSIATDLTRSTRASRLFLVSLVGAAVVDAAGVTR